MGIIENITGLMRKGPQLASKMDAMKINTKSVARGANDSTFQYSCLVSDTIPVDRTAAFVRLIERTYASFTQSWLSLHPMIDITMNQNPIQYLKQFHQNVKLEKAIEDLSVKDEYVQEYMEGVYNGEYVLYTDKDNTFGVLFNVADSGTRAMCESHKEYLKEHLAEFDLHPVVGSASLFEEDVEEDVAASSADMTRALVNSRIQKAERDERKDMLMQTDKVKAPQLLERDVKKLNDMVPFGIQVRLLAVNDKGQFVQYLDFIVGVKAVLHLIKSDEMVENIIRSLQNKNVFFKFLKWTSGEISLFKNIVLDLDNLRFDASARQNGRHTGFARLRRMKDKKIGFHAGTVPHGIIPNSTIIISSFEADYIQSKVGADLRDPKIATKIIEDLFLMTFVIVDDATSTFEVLYDGSSSYQTYSLETVEREVSMNSNKLGKEIGRMISH